MIVGIIFKDNMKYFYSFMLRFMLQTEHLGSFKKKISQKGLLNSFAGYERHYMKNQSKRKYCSFVRLGHMLSYVSFTVKSTWIGY